MPKNILRDHIRQNLDAIAQDVLKSEEPTLWHAYNFNTGIGNREELIVDSIKSYDEFNIGQDVTEWQSLSLKETSYAVGRMNTGFTLLKAKLNKNGTFDFATRILTFDDYATSFTLYKMWNNTIINYDVFLLISTVSKKHEFSLEWFQITETLDLKRVMFTRIPKKATHIKMFSVGQIVKFLVVNEEQVKSEITSADIYDLVERDIKKNEYKLWLAQSLVLNCSAINSAVNKFSNDVYLTIPQKTVNTVQIYKYVKNKFILYQTIISENVAIVIDFTIGYRTFVAIGGLSSGIYQFTKSGLKKEEIVDINFEEVTYYLSLPVKSYRDEILLLVQHHIYYGSHVSPFVKVLVYYKEKFHIHDEIPCSFLGENLNGATCIADPERHAGISGAAVINIGKKLGVLVPRYQVESGLFYFDWKLKEIENPVAKQVDRIVKARIKVEKLLRQQQKEIREIKNRLQNAVNLHEDNEITGNWRVNTIVTPNINNPNMQYIDSDEYSLDFEPFSFDSDFKVIADEIDSLEVKILKKRYAEANDDIIFDHLEINGNLDIQGESIIDNLYVETINGDNFDDLVNDCVKRSEKNKITGRKTFKNANVENINFSILNNIPAENIAYNTRKGIEVKGNITFKNVLRVQENINLFKDGKINGIDIQNEIVYMNSETTYEGVRFENLKVDYLNYVKTINDIHMDDIIKYKDIKQEGLNIVLDHLDLRNVEIKTKHINGQEFNEFLSNLCLKNNKCKFSGNVTVHGKVHVKGAAEINTLNGINYPEEYVLSQKGGFTKITGKKVFLGNVSTTELIVNKQIEGVNPNEVVTSSTSQTILGNFTFSDLEVTESFRVDGDIFIGPNLTKFIPNPTLEDRDTLDNTVLFTSLEVDGLVIVNDLFNGSTLTEIFHDVVYKDEKSIPITVEKKFTKKVTVHNNLNVDSDTINNIEINKILTLDSEQTISNNKINGDVTIENLDLSGLLNGEDLNKEFEEFIYLDSDETVFSEIIFENVNDVPDIIASELQIDKINNLNISDFILKTGDRSFGDAEFKSLKTEHVEFLKDIQHDIECFDIDDYAKNRFSLSKDQNITGKLKIINGSGEHIFAEKINDVEWEFIQDYINISDILLDKFIKGKFKIQELHVAKSLQIEELNNKNLNDLFDTVFWINQTNTLNVDIEFKDTVSAEKLQIEKLNNVDFYKFIDDIVLQTEEDVTIEGYKIFESGFTVEENLNVDKINEIPIENILLKSEEQEISGHVIVHGNVWIHEDLIVEEYINEIPVNYLQERVTVDEDKFILKGNVTFQNSVIIDNLQVMGKANGIKPEDYLNNIVGIYDDIEINGTTIFKQKVYVHKNLGVATTIDGVDINKVIEEIVLISSDDYIQGPVVFFENVEVTDTIELETDLDTKYLCGCDVQDWIDKAVYINDGYLEGNFKFEKMSATKNVNADFINDVNVKNLIPLHTNQTIDTILNVGYVICENDVPVGGLLNGFNFEEEYLNSVMINKDQEITSQLIFLNSITITDHLKTFGLVNGKNLSRLVTTNTDQNLTASYIFNGQVTFDKNLITSGKINNIDLNDWKKRTVTAFGNEEQNITGKWKMNGNVTFMKDVYGNGVLEGVDIGKLAKQIQSKQEEKNEMEKAIRNDYNDICNQVQNLVKIGKNRPYTFKHLEFHDEIILENDILAIHHFKYHHHHYLIVSEMTKCHSSLYEWIPNSFKYRTKLKTGEVEQFVTVLDSDQVYLVTKNKRSQICKDLGTNVWIFDQDSLTHIYGFNNSVFLQKSKLPGTFYSIDNKFITEYKLFYGDENTGLHTYRQWSIPQSNYSFNPRSFKWDMLDKIDNKKSRRSYPQEAIESDYERTTIENVTHKYFLPATNVREFIGLEVGSGEKLMRMTAVAVWEQTTVKGMTDEIKIYEDFETGKVFDKIPTFRPSNLNVLQFGINGEIFLVFLEDFQVLKVYEYKGNDGFKLRSSSKIAASKIITASLRVDPFHSRRKFLFLVNKNVLTLIQAYMYGDRPIDNFQCD